MRWQCPCIRAGMPYWTSRIACPRPAPRPALRAGRLPKPPCPTAVPPLVHTFFPRACGQRVGASARAGAVPAAAVCPGSALRCPRWGCQPLAQRGGRRPWLAHERWPKDPWLRCSQRPSLHGVDTGGSCGGAGEGPTPPSSTAAPSRPSRSDCRHVRLGMTVCASATPNGANSHPVKSETPPPYGDANGED